MRRKLAGLAAHRRVDMRHAEEPDVTAEEPVPVRITRRRRERKGSLTERLELDHARQMIQRVVEESGVGWIDLHLPGRCGAAAAPVRPIAEEDIAFPPPPHDRRLQRRQPATRSRGRQTAPRSKPFVGASREADKQARTVGESHAIPEKANVEARPPEHLAPPDEL